MARWFVNNLGLLFLAILIAVAAWSLASLQDDPILEDSFSVRVLRQNTPVAGEYLLTDRLPNNVVVRARGPRSVLSNLAANPPTIAVNISARWFRHPEFVDQVMAAERTLQTVIGVRDKVVTAFLEISRMQI